MPNGSLNLSVVIATFNRADTLRRTLACLAAQTLTADNFEVIVVDDGSADQTADIVSEAEVEAGFALTYLRHENRGVGYTQNRGIERTRAPVVLLIADDIWLAPDALRAHVEFHHLHPEPEAALLGRVLQSPELTGSVFLRKWDPFNFRKLPESDDLPYCMFWAWHISFKRTFMSRFGMFREHRPQGGPSAFEDLELGYRLHRHGLTIHYRRLPLGYHHHVVTFDEALQRYYGKGLNVRDFRSFVPDPEAMVFLHVLNRHTLGGHWQVLKGDNKLIGGQRRISMHIIFHLARILLLNRVMVEGIFKPMLRAAEHFPMLAPIAQPIIYRGLIHHSFLKGVTDGYRH